MREITRNIVGALVLDPSHRILLGRKAPSSGGVYSDCWHAPGGGIEQGEDQLTALKRELWEEIGLKAESLRFELIDDSGSGSAEKRLPSGETVMAKMRFFMYQVKLTDSIVRDIAPGEEFIELKWYTKEELHTLKLTPPGASLFQRLGWL